jgi:hypothetical protein
VTALLSYVPKLNQSISRRRKSAEPSLRLRTRRVELWMPANHRDVFINCPFDAEYLEFFWAIVFVVARSGFRARCALETDDSSENRFDKICKIIGECDYGIHDSCRTELDKKFNLPRFNMPLELGVFLGAKRYGQHRKRCIVLDRAKYRYQKYISDISGHDIRSHDGKRKSLIQELASWLRTQSNDPRVPGGLKIANEFASFRRKLPKICEKRSLEPSELTFGDYAKLVAEYLAETAT